MKNKNLFSRMSGWLRGFFILALAFLALGLGTLGSVSSTGKSYVLPAKTSNDVKTPCIMLQVDEPEEAQGKSLAVYAVYFNIGTIYQESGKPASIRVARGSTSQSGFYNYVDVSFENFYSEEPPAEDDKTFMKDALYNWVRYDVQSSSGWSASTYQFYKLTALTCDILINEVAFVAGEFEDGERVGESYVLDATVFYSGDNSTILPTSQGRTPEEEAKLANAIVDMGSSRVPSLAQSSYFRYSPEEVYTLMTVGEMRQGNTLSTGIYHYDRDGKTYYLADTVYNVLGSDLVALSIGIFGMSPFGLRFMSLLASFGVLVFGFLFARKLFGSDKAGFVFALLYALCGASLSLGHLGTPLMIGLCFFMAALYFTACFYKNGMKRPTVLCAVPALLGGLFAAAAICVNGAFVIPTLLLVALFALGIVRQRRKTRAALDAAIDEVEEYERTPHPEEEGVSEPRKRLGAAYNAHRICTALPCVLFIAFLVIGTLLISMLAYLPLHQTFVRLYDDPLARTRNVFYFLWKAFAGGFVGENFLPVSQSVWSGFYVLFNGTGDMHAITAAGPLVALGALFAGIVGVIFTLIRLARSVDDSALGRSGHPSFKTELTRTLLLMCGFILSLATAAFARGGLAFMLLAYLFLFFFASSAVSQKEEGGISVAIKVLSWVCLAALIIVFAVFAVATFSIPTGGFLWGLAA